jgi:hypothetical protein
MSFDEDIKEKINGNQLDEAIAQIDLRLKDLQLEQDEDSQDLKAFVSAFQVYIKRIVELRDLIIKAKHKPLTGREDFNRRMGLQLSLALSKVEAGRKSVNDMKQLIETLLNKGQ